MSGKKNLVCACSDAGLLPKSALAALLGAFKPEDTLLCSDICSMAVNSPEKLREFCSGSVRVFACHKRAASAILRRAGVEANLEFFDLRGEASEVLGKFGIPEAGAADFEFPKFDNGGWPAWYPAIDYSRCVSCGKCVDFCMFKVYVKDSNGVRVENPKSCKDGCPACARICPRQAIVFAKCEDDAIGGADEPKGDSTNEDYYEALKNRRLAAKSILKKPKS